MAKLSDLLGGGAGGAVPIWASGMTVEQGGVVLSPAAALKPYIRTSATGGGTTDPALDSATYRAWGARPVRAIFGSDLTTAADMPGIGLSAWREANQLRQTLSGALTANTYKTVLSVSGAGELNFCALSTVDAIGRNCSLRITADGVVVYEKTIVALDSQKAIVGVGGIDSSISSAAKFAPVPFFASLTVELKSSLSETDKVFAITNYWTS